MFTPNFALLVRISAQAQDKSEYFSNVTAVDSYINNLKHLASTSPCEFGSLTDELIPGRLIIVVRDSGLKIRLLRKQNLRLDKALKL